MLHQLHLLSALLVITGHFSWAQLNADENKRQKADPFDVSFLRLKAAKGDKRRTPQLQGFVEVKHNDKWKKVCVKKWTWEVANVVCGQLGFPAAERFDDEAAYLGKQKSKRQRYWISDIECTGLENKLAKCKITRPGKGFKCDTGVPLITKCVPGFKYVKKRVKRFSFESQRKHITKTVKKILLGESNVRLLSGPKEGEGRLDIKRDGRWGAVCHRGGWDLQAASVACRELGYGSAQFASRNSSYGQGYEGPIWLTKVNCHGGEKKLEECKHRKLTHRSRSYEYFPYLSDCTHSEKAGVACHIPDMKIHQKIRLVGGRTPMEGLVEVQVGKKWGPVCSDTWTAKEALVVCRHLGFGFASLALKDVYYYHGTEGANKIRMTGVDCDGSETALHYCNRHRKPRSCGDPTKSKTPYAGVICTDAAPDLIQDVSLLQRSAFVDDTPLSKLFCAHEEQCLSASAANMTWPMGSRKLLRFSSRIWNRGRADFLPAWTKDEWIWHKCHNHYHSMGVFTHYDLIDMNHTRVAQGHKASFCLEDSECDYGVEYHYDCNQPNGGIQGITVGCADTYPQDIDCQWIDVTDVKEGNYLMRVHVNPDALVPESDFNNNEVYCKVRYDGYYSKIWDCHIPDHFDDKARSNYIDPRKF